MARFLITHSLHQSWNYFHGSEASARKDFLDVLNKVRQPVSEPMRRGRQLEDDVVSHCMGDAIVGGSAFRDVSKYGACVMEIGRRVKNGLYQEKVYQGEHIFGYDCLLYGRLDFLNRNWINDVKYTEAYELGKFQQSIQHHLYMRCTKIPNFRYIVCDGRSVWEEEYCQSEQGERSLFGEIANMLDSIMRDIEMREAFVLNWTARG